MAAPLRIALTVLVLPAAALAQSADEPVRALHYDWVDATGALQGGVLALDPTDPAHVDLRTPEERARGAQLVGTSTLGVTTLQDSGPPARRVDVVFVGDGYTAGDMATYAAHVDGVLAGFFAESPLDVYQDYFNVHRVDVLSSESGVDNDPTQGIQRDTAMDMGFWCGGTERLLCVNVGKALTFAGEAPQSDTILAVANSTKYGGAGYVGNDLATLSGGNSAAIELALHEFGHSFGLLADEYTYGGPAQWTGGEPSRPNVSTYASAQMAALEAKWHEWLGTPGVGTFEGANYSTQGIYRPTNDSLMRNLGRPFDAVNVEQLVLRIYASVSPIDDATPPGDYPAATTFSVVPMVPTTHALDVQWSLDGQPIAGATGTTLDGATLGITDGQHVLEVEVVDPTPLVADPAIRAAYLTARRSWTIGEGGVVTALDGCSVNPPGSFTLTAGTAQLGETMVFAIANPLATQAAGSVGALAVSTTNLAPVDCGPFVPGLSMSDEPGVAGELLVGLAPSQLVALEFGSPTGAPTAPSTVVVSVPNDPSVAGLEVVLQGALVTPGGAGPRIGLARGLAVRFGD